MRNQKTIQSSSYSSAVTVSLQQFLHAAAGPCMHHTRRSASTGTPEACTPIPLQRLAAISPWPLRTVTGPRPRAARVTDAACVHASLAAPRARRARAPPPPRAAAAGRAWRGGLNSSRIGELTREQASIHRRPRYGHWPRRGCRATSSAPFRAWRPPSKHASHLPCRSAPMPHRPGARLFYLSRRRFAQAQPHLAYRLQLQTSHARKLSHGPMPRWPGPGGARAPDRSLALRPSRSRFVLLLAVTKLSNSIHCTFLIRPRLSFWLIPSHGGFAETDGVSAGCSVCRVRGEGGHRQPPGHGERWRGTDLKGDDRRERAQPSTSEQKASLLRGPCALCSHCHRRRPATQQP
jgi:hypothetical protein